MIPKSLSPLPPYPPSYLSKRVKYIQQVFAREASIVSSQEAADAAEDANELYEEAKEEWSVKMVALKEDGEESEGPPPMPVPPPIPAPVHVPPIPIPPCLPDEEEEEEEKTKKAKEQLSIPEDKLHLVSHLDQTCFHVTNGRYSGLITNNFADPQFVGPNAPGITGLNVSGGTGLATSYVGSSSGGGGGASHSSSYYAGVSGVLTNNGSGGGGGGAAKHNTGSTDPTSKKKILCLQKHLRRYRYLHLARIKTNHGTRWFRSRTDTYIDYQGGGVCESEWESWWYVCGGEWGDVSGCE
uniref:Uncharacterized protein n=1 Tax=Ditylum brightwellii TaxID=49249 RepID=A0A7S4RS02_9STRA